MRKQPSVKRSTAFYWQARAPHAMPFRNIFYALKAFKNGAFATGQAGRGLGVSGRFIYSI
jgi:hypothetical protein